MRLQYLAQDRIDLQFAAKELARDMQAPTEWSWQQLKRAVRYLHGCDRLVQQFFQQDMPERLPVYTDSDFAGCQRTRRSTSCTQFFLGSHLVKCTSKTQAIVSLSSGEAEFYAAVSRAAAGLGVRSLLFDLGQTLAKPIMLRVDSTACLGMAGRKGAGSVRHIHTPCLWLQGSVAKGDIVLDKVLGTDNPADIGTKAIPQQSINKILEQCGFKLLTGKSSIAFDAAV